MIEKIIQKMNIKATNMEVEVGTLSGGNQQKIVFAKWIMKSPKVLILDEPTRGIDVGAKFEIYRTIRSLADSGLCILMISSELPELIGMADRAYVMRAGEITAQLAENQLTQIQVMHYATADIG